MAVSGLMSEPPTPYEYTMSDPIGFITKAGARLTESERRAVLNLCYAINDLPPDLFLRIEDDPEPGESTVQIYLREDSVTAVCVAKSGDLSSIDA